jgi:serine/threonine protein kinase
MAPEMFQKEMHYSGKAADVWSLGVTCFSFAYLSVPFNGETVIELT